MEPEVAGFQHKYVVCHYTGTFNMALAGFHVHGNTKADNEKSKFIRAADLQSKGSPNKKSVRYANDVRYKYGVLHEYSLHIQQNKFDFFLGFL